MSARALLRAVRDLQETDLRRWLPEGVAAPRSFKLVPTTSTLADTALPALQVSSAGLLSAPRQGQGGWWAEWSVGVSVWCRGQDWDSTQELTVEYAEAVLGCLESTPDLADADGFRWVDTRLGLPDDRKGRTLGGCVVIAGYWLPHATRPASTDGPGAEPPLWQSHDIPIRPVPTMEEAP